jgi:hypothetical protein
MMSNRYTRLARGGLGTLVACTAVLALGGGVARASGYVRSGSFPSDREVFGLAVDQSSGDVYSAAEGGFAGPNSRVAQYPPPFSSVSEEFGSGTEFSGVAVNASGQYVYALDKSHSRVDIFEPSAGSTTEPLKTLGSGTISPFESWEHGVRIGVDNAGDVFVPDSIANVVYEFVHESGVVYHEPPTTIGSGTLSEPTAVAVDSTGIVYVVDSGHARVAVFSPAGEFLGALGGLTNPSGVAVDPSTNDVFVIESPGGVPRVNEFSPSTGTSPGNFAPGSSIVTFGSGEFTNGQGVFGIAVDSSSNVYVASRCGYAFCAGEVLIFKPSIPPTATTSAVEPSDVSAGGARICGLVNPHDPTESRSTTWYFKYGTDQTYGSYSPAPPPGTGDLTGASAIQVCTTLSGLQPNLTYHFQLVAHNSEGEGEGGDQTFLTSAVAPSVGGQSSSGITQTGATLHAQINPNNQATTYQFQYGTDTLYTLGSVPASPAAVGSGFGDQAESATLAGLQPNTLYHYRVVAKNATGTTSGVDHTVVTLPDAPSVTTAATSALGQSGATLNGTIDPQGAQTSYYFEYSGPGAFSMVSGEAGSGSGSVTVTAPVNGLSPGTSYQYRLIATNAGGTTVGSYQSFTTQPPPPTGPPAVATGGSSNLTPTSVTLSGTLDPNGGATGYQFQYGTSAAYGASVGEASAGSGAEPQGVAAGLSSLAAGTTYHYRLVATNAAGTSYGADQMFTTPAAPVSAFGPSPTNTILLSTTPTPPKPLTRAQKLAKALKQCKKDKSKKKRAKCEREAREKYGAKAKKKAK